MASFDRAAHHLLLVVGAALAQYQHTFRQAINKYSLVMLAQK
jgi:hypothetical protein